MAQAYCIFHCSSKELQARAGFDGWVLLLRDEFDTEDQAWAQERQRLATMVKRKMRRLESGGAELDMLQLVTSSHLLLDPPSEDREEERIWCIEFFRGKMYDFVADDRELVERLCSFQDELLLSARIGAPSPQPHHRGGSVSIDGGGQSARPSGEPSGEGAETGARGGGGGATADGSVETAAESARLDGSPKRKMSAASLSAALELTDLESAQQRFGGGAFLPILPLGSDIDSIDRGLPTLHTTTSTTRWATSC